jgi:lysyl-tRNA synthetase class 1
VYEFFLIDGQKMSSRMGNVYLVRDLLRIAEPEVVRFLYVKKPLVQRDIAVKRISKVVSEFDEIERLAHVGKGERAQDAKVYYWYVVGEPEGSVPYRLPYDLATYITRFYEPRVALERLEGSGLVPKDLTNADVERALDRLRRASNWNKMFARGAETWAGGTHEVTDQRLFRSFRALREKLAEADLGGDEIQELLYQAAREAGVSSSEFFREAYKLFLGQEHGPRLGNFLATLDKGLVLSRLDSVRLASANR